MRALRLLFFSFILIISFPIEQASGYGWGYKKNNENKLPDVGKYGEMIQPYDAYYADLSGEKYIYLTFDNGYEQGYTADILDVLKKEKVPATFFVTGHYVKTASDLIKRMVKEGHIIGNHSYTHPDFTTMSKMDMAYELIKLDKAVNEITGTKQSLKYLRPPRGTFDDNTLKWATELGYIHVFWSVAFRDWNLNEQKGWRYAYDEVMKQIHPGAIILLHAVSSDNAKALSKMIKELKKQGYTFKSLDDLLMKDMLPHFILGLE